jgi:hydroxymethylglutaryl-CoA reductase
MRLHAKNIATTAGAQGSQIDAVAEKIADEGNVNLTRAKEILKSLEKTAR